MMRVSQTARRRERGASDRVGRRSCRSSRHSTLGDFGLLGGTHRFIRRFGKRDRPQKESGQAAAVGAVMLGLLLLGLLSLRLMLLLRPGLMLRARLLCRACRLLHRLL